MIEIKGKIKGLFHFSEYWFGYPKTKLNYGFLHSIFIYQINEDIALKGFTKREFNTGITNLKKEKNEIFSSFSATKRNEINRANREGIKYEIYHKNISKKDINIYLNFYNKFAKIYNIPQIPNFIFKKYIHNLILTKATINGETLIYHAYLYDNNKVRLLHSSSKTINGIDKDLRKIISYANNGLHHFDINILKNYGYTEYDWGGIYIGEKESPSGKKKTNIAKFKLGFNPKTIKQFSYTRESFFYKIIKNIYLYFK